MPLCKDCSHCVWIDWAPVTGIDWECSLGHDMDSRYDEACDDFDGDTDEDDE